MHNNLPKFGTLYFCVDARKMNFKIVSELPQHPLIIVDLRFVNFILLLSGCSFSYIKEINIWTSISFLLNYLTGIYAILFYFKVQKNTGGKPPPAP
jgi:hypothetical protein